MTNNQIDKQLSRNRLIIGITGASGVIYGIRLLALLKENTDIETHLILSKTAEIVIAHETDYKIKDIQKLAHVTLSPNDMAACVSSGSFLTKGMIIAPCSMKTAGEIANSITTGLISRAADVILKERRPLVVMPRETPLHLNHLRNLTRIAECGGIIAPPMPPFYSRAETIAELIDHQLCRVLDLFDIHLPQLKRWKEKTCI